MEVEESCSFRKKARDAWETLAEDPKTESGTAMETMVGESKLEVAAEMYKLDTAEIIGLLPGGMSGMDVLELGGGIGRFTGELAKISKSVISTDLIESFVEENRSANGHLYPNLSFRTLDAAQLDYQPNSFDLIFSNWLLYYFNDKDLKTFIYNNLMMLRPGGYSFTRETHFNTMCGRPLITDTQIYRDMKEHYDFFTQVHYTDESGDIYHFKLLRGGNSQTYVHCKGNHTQIYYLWIKTTLDQPQLPLAAGLQQSSMFNEDAMCVYNKVIGDGFMSHGGLELAKEMIAKLSLRSESIVLDIGSGLGGLMCYLVKHYGIETIGLERSIAAGQVSVLRLCSLNVNKGILHIADLMNAEFQERSFDSIITLESLQHVTDKELILKKISTWLKPNGQLLISEYCLSDEPLSNGTTTLIKSEGLNLVTCDTFLKLMNDAGFSSITCEDYSLACSNKLSTNLAKLKVLKEVLPATKAYFNAQWSTLLIALNNKELKMANFHCKI